MSTRTSRVRQRQTRKTRPGNSGRFRNSLLARNSKDLIRLIESPPTTQKRMVAGAKKDMIMTLVEIAKNIRYGVIDLTKDDHKKLKRHFQKIKTLMLAKTSLKTRKKILQVGGFLGLLLKPLLGIGKALIGPLLGDLTR